MASGKVGFRLAAACAGVLALSVIAPANAARFKAEDLRLTDFTGEVRIVTNGGEDVDVVITQPNTGHRRVAVNLVDGVVEITGERWIEDEARNCCDTRINRVVDYKKDRKMTTGEPLDEDLFADYPLIEITMPRAGDVTFVDARMKLTMGAIDGALNLDGCYVYGEASDAGEAIIGLVHGSRLVMGNVGGKLEVDLSGDADFRAANAAMVDADIAGSGDVVLGSVDGMLDVQIAGSGTVRAARLDGPLTAKIAGSGAVAVQSGKAERLNAYIDGSGAVFMQGQADNPDLRLYGSAEVRMASVKGRIKRSGTGVVYVGDELQER